MEFYLEVENLFFKNWQSKPDMDDSRTEPGVTDNFFQGVPALKLMFTSTQDTSQKLMQHQT